MDNQPAFESGHEVKVDTADTSQQNDSQSAAAGCQRRARHGLDASSTTDQGSNAGSAQSQARQEEKRRVVGATGCSRVLAETGHHP